MYCSCAVGSDAVSLVVVLGALQKKARVEAGAEAGAGAEAASRE